MVDVDPTSGMKGKTLRALADYRRRKGKITFGIFISGMEEFNTNTNLGSDDYDNNDDDVWIKQGDDLMTA